MHAAGVPLAIVDVETTGTDPAADRVSEIAVIEAKAFSEGLALERRWFTRVNRFAGIAAEVLARYLGRRGVRVVRLAA